MQYDPPFRIVPKAERNRNYAWIEPEIVVQSNIANGRAAANYGMPSFERCASDYGASPNSHRRFALKAAAGGDLTAVSKAAGAATHKKTTFIERAFAAL